MDALQGQGEDGLEACTECGYLIAYALGVRCSECGHLYGTEELEMAQRRGGLLEDSRRFVKKAMVLWLGVVVLNTVGGLGAMYIIDNQMPWDVVYAMVFGLVCMVFGSVVAGWMAACFASGHHRRVLWLIWLRALPTIHLSWLSIGGFTVLGGVLALAGRLVAGPAGVGKDLSWLDLALEIYVGFAFAVWAIVSLGAFPVWATKLSQECGAFGLRGEQPAVGFTWLLATATWLAGGLFGLVGGAMGALMIFTIGGI